MSPLLRRVLQAVAQVAALSLFAFLLATVAPGHFYSAEKLDPLRSAGTVEAWMHDQQAAGPWPVQYLHWLRSCVEGGCGQSLAYGLPVLHLVKARWQSTAAIVIPAWLLGWLTGLALAARPRPGLTPVATAMPMLPEVISGSLLVWLMVSCGLPLGTGWVLSIVVLAAPLAAVVYLHARQGVETASRSRPVQLARQRGVSGAVLWRSYVLPAAANPLISLLAPTVAGVTGSALAVEELTGRAGLGPFFLEAFHSRDYPVVQGVLVLLGVVLAIVSLAADLLLYRLDPRIRLDREERMP